MIMPGVLLPEQPQQTMDKAAEQSEQAQQQPSYLVGPQLKVPTISALELFRQSFDKHADKLAVACMYQPADYLANIFEPGTALAPEKDKDYLRWSFAQLRRAGELFAASLAARGVTQGMTIANFARGSAEFYIVFYAALVLRCRFSPMNPQSVANAGEVGSMLTVTGANLVVAIDADTLQKLDAAVPEIMQKMVLKIALEKGKDADSRFSYLEDLVASALPFDAAAKALEPFEQRPTEPDEDVVLLFTSGTSSLPKSCPLTNRGLCSIAQNFINGPTGGPAAVICAHLPIYHIAGGISSGWNPLASGAAVIHPAPSFTAKSTLDAMVLEGVTFMILVPSMIGLITSDPDLPPEGEISIKSVSLGASTILYTDVEKCYKFLGANRVITSYGMTEGLMMTRGHLPREVTHEALNGIQSICPGARLKICKPNSHEVVPRGEAGEVHQGGATTIRGYIGKETDAFYSDEDGVWCMTGDQAIMHPDGGIQITGRYKDLIIRGGVNISPQAIEGVISKILGLEAYVVGMPDSIAGEVPVAIVRKADAGKASLAKLREPIVKELGPKFALEKFISLEELGMTDFPKTSTGKIRKVDLQSAVKQYAREKNADEAGPASSSDEPALKKLLELWADVAGVDPAEVSAETNVHDMADSLMLARFANTVRSTFGRPFSLPDLTKHRTLGEQAELLDSRREQDSTNIDLLNDREGPPDAEDMVHTEEDDVAAVQTRRLVEAVIEPLGFEWNDVQDVFTPSQWLQSWVKSRPTSDRFRGAYITHHSDVNKLKAAFEQVLLRNDSLRCVSVKMGDGSDCQAILRHTPKWLAKTVTVREESVKKPADLERVIPADYPLAGGLLHAVICHVEETNTAGLCLMTLHTTFDAFSLDIMRKDLNTILNDQKPKQHVPYKLWGDHLYNTRDSAQARAAVNYNVNRLKGVGKLRRSLWPPQRTPVWQRGCDRGLSVTYDGRVTTADDPHRRPLLDGNPKDCIGSAGIRREHAPVDLQTLTSQHQIPPPILVKAALSMLETRHTGTAQALFTQTFAMRDDWPFVDPWVSRRLPSPLEVTGPTLTRIAEIIPVRGNQTVLEWLQQLKAEQERVVKHAHAPYRQVYDRLNKVESPLFDEYQFAKGKASPSPVRKMRDYLGLERTGSSDSRPLSVDIVPEVPSPDTLDITIDSSSIIGSNSSSGGSDLHGESAIETTSALLPTLAALGADRQSRRESRRPSDAQTLVHEGSQSRRNSMSSMGSPNEFYLPRARDGEVMESIRQRINLQWLPIFKNDSKQKPQVRFVSNSHFNEVGLAVKSGLLADHKTIWIKMEWDDGNISSSDATGWIDEMTAYVAALGQEANWSRPIADVIAAARPAEPEPAPASAKE